VKNQVRRLLEVIHQFRLAPDGARPAVDALEGPREGRLPQPAVPHTLATAQATVLPAGATPRQPQLSMAPR
jgi:methyl-accepting chemotaxis protein-1 (serine sensor receptor)